MSKAGRPPGQHQDTRQKMWLCYHLTKITNNKRPQKAQHKAETQTGNHGIFREVAQRWLPEYDRRLDPLVHLVESLSRRGFERRKTSAGDDDYYAWLNHREFVWWSLERANEPSLNTGNFSAEHLQAVERWYDEHPEVPRRIQSKSYKLDLTPAELKEIKTRDNLTHDEVERFKFVRRQWAALGYDAAVAEAKRRLGEPADPWMKRDYEEWKLEANYNQASPVAWIPTPKSMEAAQDAERAESLKRMKVVQDAERASRLKVRKKRIAI